MLKEFDEEMDHTFGGFFNRVDLLTHDLHYLELVPSQMEYLLVVVQQLFLHL